MPLDPALTTLLDIDSSTTEATQTSHGSSGFTTTSKITVTPKDDQQQPTVYFLKTSSSSSANSMFAGEHTSLNALNDSCPSLCPRSLGHGSLTDKPETSFLLTEFLDLTGRRRGTTSKNPSALSLAQKLARLHTTPAPIPDGYSKPQFGFPVPTSCGETVQDNTLTASWAEFYAERRLRAIVRRSKETNGSDSELEKIVERVCSEVVPRLLSDEHLNGGKGVLPVVVHGDLWSGNVGFGRIDGRMDSPEEVVFDSSACYAHSEFELGIMRMFGGFARDFMDEYHQLVPKTKPVEEYDDRVKLYELYHHLNHHAMFGGGYRGGAVSIMRGLLGKYAE